ncbi:MAG: L,D-transpeptidase family protein [Myxococcota bacterium]
MGERRIVVQVGPQQLELWDGDERLAVYPVSTSARGTGERDGSEQTPRGRHRVCRKIGAGCPPRSVFVAREPTGEVCTPERFAADPERDWILTRILWLDGQEEGRNRGAGVDSRERFVYIHGTPDEASIGRPASHGCIRMRNDDVIELFDRVEVDTPVEIVE